MASGVWWLLTRARFPGTTMGSTGKVCNPRAWSKTPTLQASLNRSAIKHDFINPYSPLLPRLMMLHLNWVAHPAASLMWQGGSGMVIGNSNDKMVLPSKPASTGQMGHRCLCPFTVLLRIDYTKGGPLATSDNWKVPWEQDRGGKGF